MNMFPLSEETLRREHALNREPEVRARSQQHRMLEDAGLVRRSRFSCQLCRRLRSLGQQLVTNSQRLLTGRPQTE